MAKKSKTDRGETVTQLPETDLLAAAVHATKTGSPCFAHMADIVPLVEHPSGQLVEYNEAMADGTGRIALRATAIGVQVFQANGNRAAQTAFPNGGTHEPPAFPFPPQPATVGNPGDYEPAFAPGQNSTPFASSPVVGSYTALTPRPVFKKGIPIPPPRAKRESTKKYQFDHMEIGDCFDTMSTGDNPEPWKRLSSAVTAASKRFAPKKFETWPIEEEGVKFARTWRTA